MQRPKLILKLIPTLFPTLLIGLTFAPLGARAQSAASDAQATPAPNANAVMKSYTQATPYLNNPAEDLKRAVPPLNALKAEEDQSNLASILSHAGDAIKEQVPRMLNISAHESVSEMHYPAGGPINAQGYQAAARSSSRSAGSNPFALGGALQQGATAPDKMDEQQLEQSLQISLLTKAPWRDYDYMITTRKTDQDGPVLDESRTSSKTQSSKGARHEDEMLHGIGFGYLWMMFLPQNQPQSSYRYLGREKMYGHETFVVAFAQRPEQVKVAGEINISGNLFPLLYQGIAWIDAATYRMVRLRTDLLAPLPSLNLERFTSDIRLSEVRISELNLPLWLPDQAELLWKQNGELSGEMHIYSKYHLFHATMKIVPAM